ncbi:MAG: hypothetical protein FJ291_29880, partial [Planctomycetes bacterium]|nr:hypothetical protein [Planctomycetota bacterium]
MHWPLSSAIALSLVALAAAAAEEAINPYPRALMRTESLMKWSFEAGEAGWTALHDCALAAEKGVLRVKC